MEKNKLKRTKTERIDVVSKNRVKIVYGLVSLAVFLLAVQLMNVQVIKADEYEHEAMLLHTGDHSIEASRGDILDRNGEVLATSTPVKTLEMNPSIFSADYDKNKDILDEFIVSLSKILEVDNNELQAKMVSDSQFASLKSNIPLDTAETVSDLILQYDADGLVLVDEIKRNYPLGIFASSALGHLNVDDVGIGGVEQMYDRYLGGVDGRLVKTQDLLGRPLPLGVDDYYEVYDGLNVVLTVDEVVQFYLEESIKATQASMNADRVMAIVMDPNTGDILGMGNTPSFDPNSPDSFSSSDSKLSDEFNAMSETEQIEYLYSLWSNPLISEVYEPGSTLKLITVASVLEESLVNLNSTFYCSGTKQIYDYTISCWHSEGHGTQTLSEALANSCNPAHMEMAAMLGDEVFYEYLEKFGFTEKTGVDLPSETGSIVHSPENIGPVELATMGFGHGISITPLQLITAISSIGNDGYLMEPRIVMGLQDEDGNMVENYEPNVVRKTISDETVKMVQDMMVYSVEQSSRNTSEYTIGGKTGSAQKVYGDSYSDELFSSFICLAPMEDPQVAILYIVDNPQYGQGGSVAAMPPAIDLADKIQQYYAINPES